MSQAKPTPVEVNTFAEVALQVDDMGAAFRAAFPETKAAQKTAREKGSRFARRTDVRAKTEELREVAKHLVSVEFAVSIADKKRILASVAQKALSKGTSLAAAVSAVAELNRMDGHHAAPQAPLGPDGQLAPNITMTADEYKQARAEMLALDDC